MLIILPLLTVTNSPSLDLIQHQGNLPNLPSHEKSSQPPLSPVPSDSHKAYMTIQSDPLWPLMVMAANPPLRHATNWTQTEAPFDEPSSTSCHDSPPAMPGWNSSSLSLRTTITHLSNSKWCYSNYSIQYTVYYSNYGINTATWLASAKSFDSAIFSQLMPTLYCGAWLILKYQKNKTVHSTCNFAPEELLLRIMTHHITGNMYSDTVLPSYPL